MWKFYDYLKENGRNDIAQWTRTFSTERRVKLRAKVDIVRRIGTDAPTEVLGDLGGGLYKLKIKGKPQLRPLLCLGTLDNENEFTFLIGAIEENGKLIPKDVIERARSRRAELLADPSRRIEHEEVD